MGLDSQNSPPGNEDFHAEAEKSFGMRGYLDPGETVRFQARPHTAALFRPLSRSLLLALAGGVLVGLSPPALGVVGAILLGMGALLALRAVMRWDRTSLIVTTEKLLVIHGVARRRAAAVRFARVGPVEVEQGLVGRLFGYGTVIAGDLEIPYVPDPRRVGRLAS